VTTAPTVHRLTPTEARRIAVRAQLLDQPRPTDLLTVARHLTVLQLDQTSAVAPSADLVLWSRLGTTYSPQHLRDALDELSLIELRGMARPAEDIALHRDEMAHWPGTGDLLDWQVARRDWVRANNGCRREILELLRTDGPLPASELPDTCEVPWSSSGWNNNRNLTMLLDFMVARGEIAPAGGQGRDRLWDLASRIYPDDPVVPAAEAQRILDERRLRALGLARSRAPKSPGEPNDVGQAGEPAEVEGVKGKWRVDPVYLDGAGFEGRTALLSPLDRLVYDRKRMVELFDFDYQLEMYKPAGQRRWGYFALPVLYGDRLVGKVDATTERDAGVLRVDALHEDVPFTKAMRAAVEDEIDELARWLQVERVGPS